MKKFYLALAAIAYVVVVVGVVAPMLVSAKNTLAFVLGVSLILGPVIAGAHYAYNRHLKSTKDHDQP